MHNSSSSTVSVHSPPSYDFNLSFRCISNGRIRTAENEEWFHGKPKHSTTIAVAESSFVGSLTGGNGEWQPHFTWSFFCFSEGGGSSRNVDRKWLGQPARQSGGKWKNKSVAVSHVLIFLTMRKKNTEKRRSCAKRQFTIVLRVDVNSELLNRNVKESLIVCRSCLGQLERKLCGWAPF